MSLWNLNFRNFFDTMGIRVILNDRWEEFLKIKSCDSKKVCIICHLKLIRNRYRLDWFHLEAIFKHRGLRRFPRFFKLIRLEFFVVEYLFEFHPVLEDTRRARGNNMDLWHGIHLWYVPILVPLWSRSRYIRRNTMFRDVHHSRNYTRHCAHWSEVEWRGVCQTLSLGIWLQC